jgi:hypothetical protein
MSGPKTRLQAAAAAGFGQETDSCGKEKGGENHQARVSIIENKFARYQMNIRTACADVCLRMGEPRFVFDLCFYRQAYTHSHLIQPNVRPQGGQVREHAWRQLLKLVAVKEQIAVAKQKVEIDQIEPEKIVSARDRDGSGDVFVRFRSCCGIII